MKSVCFEILHWKEYNLVWRYCNVKTTEKKEMGDVMGNQGKEKCSLGDKFAETLF